ncbi:MAG TPA: LuxR C-terminal-related transcriptional regulator [Aggregatilinea sp.]|uniref:LuxR C-terminal-related transcriptional regulator n=1 Tax=Aggregatilinea sp. TaxID=2806333 RepID=UPI002D08B1A0|nr:LuxR C-terminal-related transcriptional regulator [Aggregatilinea sp.]HML21353.1 LuxR C-terminal-related transcriptional regulator [Aggregatilinea sp.]
MHRFALPPTSFVGRAQEIDEIGALLATPSCRLLTLVGPGGIGKTRLAIEAAERLSDVFPDGVYFVPLAALSRADDILAAIADATPFRFQAEAKDPREQFFSYLRDKQSKRMLLVMDNFEHLLDGVDLVSDILEATTGLKILATSREALNLQEEWVRQIVGLVYPERGNGKPLESYSAVQLFVDRAQRVRGDFDLAEDGPVVTEICRLVEGMPLAIELAAGWLKTLQPDGIVQEIRRSMDILATRSRNLPERHRSIRSVFSHSWELLHDDERDIFRKLSVFRGGFTREAAEVVAGASLNGLAGLVDKSLVRLSETGRYSVHELLRQYGAEQLDASGQTVTVQRAYVDYYLGMLHKLEPDIKSHGQINALNLIEADFKNVRHAWHLAEEQGYVAAQDRAVESLHFFADMRGRYHEVVKLLRATIAHLAPETGAEQVRARDRVRARLVRLIMLGNMRIDIDPRAEIDDCLRAARERGDRAETGFCLLTAGIVSVWESNLGCCDAQAESDAFFRASYEIQETLNDPFYMAEAYVWQGSSSIYDGHRVKGTEILLRNLELRREIGDRNGIAWIMLNLSEAMLTDLDYQTCEQYIREGLALMREIGSLKGILQALFKMAALEMLKGNLDEARALAEEMYELAHETSSLDAKMLSTGILAFMHSVMEEDYLCGEELALQNYAISLEPFFGYNDVAALWGRAAAMCGLGQYEAMRASYPSLCWERRDDPGPASVILALEAAARAHEGAYDSAAELLGLAFGQPEWTNGWLHHWALLNRLRADLETHLGAAAFQAAQERGSHLDLESTVRMLLGEADSVRVMEPANQPLVEPLSPRELEVLDLIGQGLSNREIAERLSLSVGTVKVHTRNIYGKLDVNSRTQALAQAAKFNLL